MGGSQDVLSFKDILKKRDRQWVCGGLGGGTGSGRGGGAGEAPPRPLRQTGTSAPTNQPRGSSSGHEGPRYVLTTTTTTTTTTDADGCG